MTTVSAEQLLQNCSLVTFQTRTFSAVRDTGLGSSESEGRMEKVLQRCVDAATLRPFNRIKIDCSRVCRNYGTRIDSLGAWAISPEKVAEVSAILEKNREDWYAYTTELADKIGNVVREFADRNPSNRQAIYDLAPTSESILRSTKFLFAVYRLNADDLEKTTSIEDEITDMPMQVLREIKATLMDAGMDGAAEKYTKRGLQVLARIADKASSFAFLSPKIQNVHEVISDVCKTLDQSPSIGPSQVLLLNALCEQLMNPFALYSKGFQLPSPDPQAQPVVKAPAAPAPKQSPVASMADQLIAF